MTAVTKVLTTMAVMEVLTMMAVMKVLAMRAVMDVLTTMVVISYWLQWQLRQQRWRYWLRC